MKIEHLDERIQDYLESIEKVIEKKILWQDTTKPLLKETLNKIAIRYDIGWKVQELSWLNSNEAINITFDSFPTKLLEKTQLIRSYQFIQGCSLVFSQSYNGEVHIFILFPIIENIQDDNSSLNLGIYDPQEITEKVIIEKVDGFLKQVINWEVPVEKKQLGFISEK